MKTFITTIGLSILLVVGMTPYVFAAKMYIEAPKTVSSNRAPLTLSIFLDSEGDSISGLSANFSFPSDLFDVKSITTDGGIVSFWAISPHVSKEAYFDQRTHIIFDGIIPGGFSGVRSAYYNGAKAGVLFTVTLIPKEKGVGIFKLEDIELHAFDKDATLLPSQDDVREVRVPYLTGEPTLISKVSKEVTSDTLITTLYHSDLVSNDALYLYVHDENPSNTIDHIEIRESSVYDTETPSSYSWRIVTNPYTIQNEARGGQLHVKAVYTNNTFSVRTVVPVENSTTFRYLSRILIGIVIVLLLFFSYGKNFLYFSSKFNRKSHNKTP